LSIAAFQQLRNRYDEATQSVELLDGLEPQPTAIFSHFDIAEELGVSTRRVGLVLGNIVHVQHWHGIALLVRIGRVRQGRHWVSLWQWAGVS
jgi:hypothetical protein